MSRCFPYPPPGYEKKPRSDHVDLLIKEKHKEKKHKKKEKQEKEKREGKERKDKHKEKDRSKDKHKEKKDKNEKKRERDKKKSKDGEKDSRRISNKRNAQDCTEGHNDDKLAEDGHKADNLKDSCFAAELVRRNRDEESGAASQMGDKHTGKLQRFENMGNPAQERNLGGEMVHDISVSDQRGVDMASAIEDRGTGNARPQEQRRVDGMGSSTDKDAKRRVEAKEKTQERKVDGKKGHKNDKDQGKKHKRDKDRDKEKAKEEKVREKEEHKHKDRVKSIGIVQKGYVDPQNVGSSLNSQDTGKNAGAEKSLKRKEINGFLLGTEVQPNKLSRPTSSSQLPLGNGRKLDSNHITTQCASDGHEAESIMKVETALENKKHKINGVVYVQPPSNELRPPIEATRSVETLNRPPHPDEKYLSQILSLPKMEEWPELDDQGWLFNRDETRQKPKTMPEPDEKLQVWDKALHIDAADVLALPYVIPY